MANDKKGCCGDAEFKEEPIKEKSTESCCGSEDNNLEEDDECGCGCGGAEYPDTSTKDNPNKPKFIADDEFFKEFENYAYSLGFKSVGYTQLTPELLTENKFMQYTNTIVLTIEMDNEIIETPPGEEAQRLNNLAYEKTGRLTYMLSDYLREKGYATEIAHSYDSTVKLSALAQKAGLGFIGNNGLLITPELGSRLKISAITVSIANLPIKDENEHDWIPEYCEKCGKCVKACPHEALIEKETCCGGKEVKFVRKQCIGCSQGCTYCIEGCPFDQKGYEHVKNKFDKMNAKLKEKQNPQTPCVWGTKNLRFFECKKFKVELLDNWAKENSNLFTDLVVGATIAISMPQDEEHLVILEKENNTLNMSVKSLKELERPVADLLFLIDEKDIKEILNDDTSVKFTELVSSGKINVYGLINQIQLVNKGYITFLNRLNLSIGSNNSCCC